MLRVFCKTHVLLIGILQARLTDDFVINLSSGATDGDAFATLFTHINLFKRFDLAIVLMAGVVPILYKYVKKYVCVLLLLVMMMMLLLLSSSSRF